MRAGLVALALPLLLLTPAAVAAPTTVTETKRACADPAALVACVEGTVTGSFECQRHNATAVSCWANGTWSYRGFSNLPALGGGDATRAGGLNVDWCDIGGLCRGVGVGLLIVGCQYHYQQACGGSLQHSMWLGTPRIGPGQCIDFTFTPWIYVYGNFQPAPVSAVVAKVNNAPGNGPALEAYAAPEIVEHVCN